MSSVEVEVRMAKVDKRDACDEQKQVRVVALAGRLEGIVAELVAVGQVMNIVLLLPGVASSVAREVVGMAAQAQQSVVNATETLTSKAEGRFDGARDWSVHGPGTQSASARRSKASSCCKEPGTCGLRQASRLRASGRLRMPAQASYAASLDDSKPASA